MDIIFIVGVVQSFFFAFLISSKKRKSYADKILASWLILIGIHLLYFIYEYNRWQYQFPALYGYGAFFPTLHGPMLFLYFRALISRKSKPHWKDLLHFFPFLVANLLILDILIQPGDAKLKWLQELQTIPTAIHLGDFLNNIVGPIYIGIVLYQIRKHQQRIKNIFSYTEDVSLQWIKNVTYGLGMIWIVVLVSTTAQYFISSSLQPYTGLMIYVTVVLFVFSIGYFGFKQTSIFSDFSSPEPILSTTVVAKPYAKSGLNENESELIKANLLTFMADHQPYLEGSLTIDQLTNELEVNKHQLSQVINEKLGLSFFDFINKHRISAFKRKVEQGDAEKFTLLGIAFDCGFNSKASFNRIFKSQTGMTPSAYISSEKQL